MRKHSIRAIALGAALPLVALTACTTDPSVTETTTAAATPSAAQTSPASQDWFDQALYDEQFMQRSATFEGNAEQPYLQYIAGNMTDTAKFASSGAKKVCFANASISNPWRQTGWITMNQQLKVLKDSGVISEMETRDAKDNDNTQIADIDYFIDEANCDAFVISPNSTAALTQAVERACKTNKPVVTLLWVSSAAGGRGCCVECSVDPSGEVAFDAPADFLFSPSFGLSFLDVFDGFGVECHPADGDHVQGFVQGSVAAAVESVPDGVPGRCRDRVDAGEGGVGGLGTHPAVVGPRGEADGGCDGTEAFFVQQWGGFADLDQIGDLAAVGLNVRVELADAFGEPDSFGTGNGQGQRFFTGTPAGHVGDLGSGQGFPGVETQIVHPEQRG
jgi:hypothetical protein